MSRFGGGGGAGTPRGSLPSTPRTVRKEPVQEEEGEEKDEAMANAERELAEDAEWKRIQQNTFTRWVNEHLRQAGTSIEHLETDFSNGLKLIALLEVLSGKKMPRHNKKPTFRSQKLENVSIALSFLENEGVHLVNIDSTDITDCKLKLILGLIWTLILHYSISMPMYDGPELGGPVEDKTPKQRLMGWLQNKLPNVPVNNFTSDWKDGRKVGALVDSVAPGLCPDWEDWDPKDPVRNATEAMDLADSWLGVPKLLTPEEIVNPNVDEMSMMTYLSQFPNAKVKDGAPLRAKAVPSKVRAFGPGLEPVGVVAKAPANFTVETFGAGDGELTLTAKGPNDVDYKVDKNYNNDRKKSYACSYYPDKEGPYVVNVLYARRNVPNSPFNVLVEGFAGDANKVTAVGPGIEPEGVVANKPTHFQIFTAGAGKGKPEVVVLDPTGRKDTVPAKILPEDNDTYRCEYMPTQLGVHSVNVFFAGNPIPESPFGVKVGPASNAGKVTASGRGLQPQGIRALEQVDFKVFTEGAGDGTANVKIIGPGGAIIPTTHRNIDPHTIEYKYTPEREGKHVVMITWAGKEIPRSPFNVNVSPQKTSKIKAFGPGLKGGVVDMPALFTVDTCGETGALGFTIEGPSQAKINCKDNGDGSADVDYIPTVQGEYAVHILCDNEDIPGSPYMAQILPKTDYHPDRVKCYGPGIESTVFPKQETHFTIDTTEAGRAPLDIAIVDDYGERKPLWKDANGIHDPKDGGIMAIKLLKGKELVKADMVGKSDPYAVIRHGGQKYTTKVIKNTLEPEWNYEAQVNIPDQGDKTITIEVFDKDKIGKDKSLGFVTFDTARVVSDKEIPADWYPLDGVASGQILLSADFLPAEPSIYREPELLRKTSHANLEVKRPILEMVSEGIYECRYTPRKTKKQVVNVNFGGVAVPGSPFKVNVDDPTDPAKVRVYGPGVEPGVTSGTPVGFTVDCTKAGPGDMEVDITDDARRAVPTAVKDNSNGTYHVEYTAARPGIHFVTVKYDGRELPQSPIKVEVKSNLDLTKIRIKDLDPEAFVGCTSNFVVDASDLGPFETGPVGTPGTLAGKVKCSVTSPDGSPLPNVTVAKPTGAGEVAVGYTPMVEGPHKVALTFDGETLPGSPFPVKARKGSDSGRVKAYGPGLERGYVQEKNVFTVETKNAGTGALGLTIEGPSEAQLICKDNQNGTCTVDYTPIEEGEYEIFVKYDDKNIKGSPFKVPVEDRRGLGADGRKGSAGRLGAGGLKAGGKGTGGDGAGDDHIPPGTVILTLVKAKELIKSDLIGKSDPYVVVKYGQQKFKTKTINNTQEPEWNHDCEVLVPDGNANTINIEVFDSDTLGKDKSLGKLNLSVPEVISNADSGVGKWYPLTGVKSGQILLNADFLPTTDGQGPGRAEGANPLEKRRSADNLLGRDNDKNRGDNPLSGRGGDGADSGRRGSGADSDDDSDGRKASGAGVLGAAGLLGRGGDHGDDDGVFAGQIHVDLIKGRNLIKADLIGKSDPYAVLKFGKQKEKTNTILNTLEPQWDFSTDFNAPDGNAKTLSIEVFDADKLGKDKSLGRVEVDLKDIGGTEARWFPLQGVKSGEILLNMDLVPHGGVGGSTGGLPAALKGGKGDGPADASKVKAFGPGLEKGKVEPGVPTHFTIDSSKTGPATIDVDILDDAGGDAGGRRPNLAPTGPGLHEATYVPPLDGKPYKVGVKYGGQNIPNSPFKVTPGAAKAGDNSPSGSRRASGKLGAGRDGRGGLGDDDTDAIIHVDLIKARDLIKTDIMGKSDPYALVKFGKQKEKTDTIKNTQEPQWDFSHDFLFPDEDDQAQTLSVEVYDHSTVGKDKSLGRLDLDLSELGDGTQAKWFPLAGVKSGEVLLNSNMLLAGDYDQTGGMADQSTKAKGGKGDGPADAAKVKAFGPGLEKGKVEPGVPTHFTIDSSKTGPATIDVDIRDPSGNSVGGKPTVKPTGPGLHEARYVPPGDGEPYEVGVKYGGQDVPGSPFHVTPTDGGTSGDPRAGGKKSSTGLAGAGLAGSGLAGGLEDFEGKLRVDLIKAKELMQADARGKSDPYAVLKFGKQKDKTETIRNTLEPQWDHRKDFKVPDGNDKSLSIEVFDHDKLGKDKSLGKIELDLATLQEEAGPAPRWFPLMGAKSGQILLHADLIPKGADESDYPSLPLPIKGGKGDGPADASKVKAHGPGLEPGKVHPGELANFKVDSSKTGPASVDVNLIDPAGRHVGKKPVITPAGTGLHDVSYLPPLEDDPYRVEVLYGGQDVPGSPFDVLKDGADSRKGSMAGSNRRGTVGDGSGADLADFEGKVRVDLVRGKDLVQADIRGKSDPYAVLKLGKQKDKTNVVRNTQDPQWDYSKDFKVPDGDSRTLSVEVFDHDKLGKDKSLGKLDLGLEDLQGTSNGDGTWFPLQGVKTGQVLLHANLIPLGADESLYPGLPDKIKGGKGDGPADASKVKAYGPGLEPDKIMPEKPATFSVDSSKTGPAAIDVAITDKDGNPVGRKPTIGAGSGGPGHHDVTYVPPPEGEPYQVDVKYGGQDVPGSPFNMAAGPDDRDHNDDGDLGVGRKGSKIGVSVNPDAENLGKVHVTLLEARDLAKSDMIGKSDPYAILSHGNQKFRTNTVKGSQHPKWKYDADFNVPDQGDDRIKVDIYDADKIGKDKLLGSAFFDVHDVMAEGKVPPGWYPLRGAKSGEVLMSAYFEPISGSGIGGGLSGAEKLHDGDGKRVAPLGRTGTRDRLMGGDGSSPVTVGDSRVGKGHGGGADDDKSMDGVLHVDVLGARNLIKADLIGKSDPYAVISLGDQSHKTGVVKNTLNPEWNFGADFDVDDRTPPDIKINIFDHDKLGKDKSLGSLTLPVRDLPEGSGWYPLAGVKSGEVLVSTNFQPQDDPNSGGSGNFDQLHGHGTGRQNSTTTGGGRNGSEAGGGANGAKKSLTGGRGIGDDGAIGVGIGDEDEASQVGEIGLGGKKLSQGGGKKLRDRLTSGEGGSGKEEDGPLIPGIIKLDVIQAKDLIKADMIGKSDPYAVISFDNDKLKTNTIKNNQNPQWNFDANIPIDEQGPRNIKIDVFDSDKFGKDKPLGSANINVSNIVNGNPLENDWLPLSGVKAGKVQVSADFIPGLELDSQGRKKSSGLDDKANRATRGASTGLGDSDNDDEDYATSPGSRKRSGLAGHGFSDGEDGTPEGTIHLDIIEAKDLVKADIIGKSDPYAVVTCGDKKVKTNSVKNNQNPKWKFQTDIPLEEGGPRKMSIEVFDADRSGKDKSLGKADIDLLDIIDKAPVDETWIPLTGVKSGKLKYAADFTPGDNYDIVKRGSISGPKRSVHDDDNLYGIGSDSRKNSQNQPGGPSNADRKAREGSVIGFPGPGNVNVNVIQAKDLIKADLIGKVDPYAVISYGNDKEKSKPVKNNQNPQWNFETNIPVDENSEGSLKIDVFDSDRFGKDKPLGSANIDLHDIANGNPLDSAWIPLTGVKSGHIQVSADYKPESDIGGSHDKPHGVAFGGGKAVKDKLGDPRKDSLDENRHGSKPVQRKPSDLSSGDEFPPGNILLNIHQAKDLVKKDMIGKSDPYAVISYDNDKVKTNTVKNNQNPEWNFEAEIPVHPDGPRTVNIDLYDEDKHGKDKPLGSAEIDIPSVVNNGPMDKTWLPLKGVKSGQLQLSADFEPEDQLDSSRRASTGFGGAKDFKERSLSRKSSEDVMGRKPSDSKSVGRKPSESELLEEPLNLHLNIIQGKDLMKTDLIGKSDPYAVITCGDNKLKTKTVKNNLNPEWNFEADIPIDPNRPSTIKVDIFDEDKLGKDKPLGSAIIDVENILHNGPIDNAWVPLAGAKSGQIKLSAEVEDLSNSRKPSTSDDSRDGNRKPSGLGGAKYVKDKILGRKPSDDSFGDKVGQDRFEEPSEGDGNGSRKSSGLGGVRSMKGKMFSQKSSDDLLDSDRKTSSASSGRKGSLGNLIDEPLNLHLNIIQGRDLPKTDIIGKSDPYAVVTYGDQKLKTKTVKNNQNPNWNFVEDIPIYPNGPDTIKVEIFDEDTFGKDKPIGSTDIDIPDLLNSGNMDRAWVPLSGTKSGKIQLSAELGPELDPGQRKHSEGYGGAADPKTRFGSPGYQDTKTSSRKPSGDEGVDGSKPFNRKTSGSNDPVEPGNLHLNIIRGKDLVKSDIIGKSDPYVVVTYGNDKVKTPTVKNSQNPEYNFVADIPILPNGPDFIKIEVFDKDKFGKDKSLGSTNIDIPSLQHSQSLSDIWVPLDNVKSGQVQISADFSKDDSLGSESWQPRKGSYNQGSGPLSDNDRKGSESYPSRKGSQNDWPDRPDSRKGSRDHKISLGGGGAVGLRDKLRGRSQSREDPDYDNRSGSLGDPRRAKSPEDDKLGTIKLNLLCAKDLPKTDLIGKSDPYAVVTYGDQKYRTEILNNTQDPNWNILFDLDVPEGNERNVNITIYDSDKFGKDKPLGEYNIDVGKVMNQGGLDQGWYPLGGTKSGEIMVSADFVPNLGIGGVSSETRILHSYMETRRTSTQYHEVTLNSIPLPSGGGKIDAKIRRPSGVVDTPLVEDNNNGTVAIKYQPSEDGLHYLDVKYNGDQVQGSPFKFHVTKPSGNQAFAYGPGLTHGVTGEPANFQISTKGAGAGGLSLAVEGPSKADITCHDNKDGTVNVQYVPSAPGEYKITAKFADKHIPGSPFTCKITGEGKKRNQISVGSSSELQLPGDLSEADIRTLKASIQNPSGGVEQCFLKRLPKGNIGISFTPREVGEHRVSVQKNGKHIANSPFKIVVNAQEVGDASRVRVSGDGLTNGETHIYNRFQINTKSAGYGGLSLSIEGPSKAEIECKDNEDGTLDVDYKPTEPGMYVINIKFADSHVPGSPFQVPISGEGTEKQTENIHRMREAVPVTEVGSQCRLTFKMPGIQEKDLSATVTSPSGKTSRAHLAELEEGLYAVNFVPHELGIHTVTVRYREIDIPGSPFQFTVGPLQDSGSHRVHAGGPGLERGVEGEPAEFNVWTREAGPGSLAISVEGPSKAQIDFKDRKDGSCYVSYIVEEPGEYSVGIRFNDQHIPSSPFRVFIIPRSDHADKVRVSNMDREEVGLNTPQSFLLSKNGAAGSLECKMVSPSGREDDCFLSKVGEDEYSVRFVPKEEGVHYLHAKLDGVHVRGSPFKIKVGGEGRTDGIVRVAGRGLERVQIGQPASFVIDTTEVGAGTLSVTVDGPSKVDMDCIEVEKGYEVSYTPTVPGDYFVTVKYNGTNVEGSPFKVTAYGGVGTTGNGEYVKARRESTSMTMETIQHTMIRQESTFQESSSTVSRSSSRQIPIEFTSDASLCSMAGEGLDRPILGKQNSFTVDCSRGGSNVLFVGVYGPDTPCDEVFVKHMGNKQYGVSYRLKERGQYILYVKWGDEHISGSPYHIHV